MRAVITACLALATILAFACAAFAATAIRSDVQLIVVAVCFLGGCMLGGILALLEGQDRILKKLKQYDERA